MFDELMSELVAVYKSRLKNSNIQVSNACLGNDTKFIKCYIAQNANECAWNILDNDMLNIMFRVRILSDNTFELTNCAKNYLLKPTNQYYAYSSRELSFRKVIGNSDKIVATFTKFIDKMIEQLRADLQADLIHENHKELLVAKLGC